MIYNINYFKDTECQICGKPSEDIHHIKFQCNANENGLIDNRFHKNEIYNLIALCKNCHNKVHRNKIEIEGYKSTTTGKILIYKNLSENKLL